MMLTCHITTPENSYSDLILGQAGGPFFGPGFYWHFLMSLTGQDEAAMKDRNFSSLSRLGENV